MATGGTDRKRTENNMTQIFEQILARTAERHNIKPEEILRDKNHELISIRNEAMYLCRKITRVTGREIGKFFNVTASTVFLRTDNYEALLSVEIKLRRKIQEEIGYLLLVMELHTIHGDIVLGEAKLIVLREQEKQLQGKIEKMK